MKKLTIQWLFLVAALVASQMAAPQTMQPSIAITGDGVQKRLPDLDDPTSEKHKAPAQSPNFNAAVDQLSPLTTEEIIALRKRLDAAKRAASTHPRVPPKPVIKSEIVDLSPGATPPLIRVSNQGAAVSFMDVTGAPWDILEVNNMSSSRFDVQQPVKEVPTITITPKGDYVEGNAAVFLKGLNIPVIIKMIAGQAETDYRRDLTIPRRGPNAINPVAAEAPISLPQAYMQNLLDGVEAPEARPLQIQNAPIGTKAWAVGDKIVLRTTLMLNNPAYLGSLAAADGTRVYEIPMTPVVSVSDNGVLRNIYIELE